MNVGYFRSFMIGLMISGSLFANIEKQDHVIIKNYNAVTDKQVIKNMIEENWYELCGGYVHGYREYLADQMLDDAQNYFKVLYCDNQIAGFIRYYQGSESRIHVGSLAIHKNYRKKGFGTLLLQHVFDLCTILEIDYITIDTMLSNEISRNLYENKFGFIPLYLKKYKNLELHQESDPVLALGRAIDPLMWNELVRNAIIIADFAGAEMHEYRMTEIL